MAPDDLVGVWRLVSYVEVDEAGRHHEGPLGPAPEGLLLYRADGWMAVSMMRTGPAVAPGGGVGDAPGLREGYMGYAGRWRLASPARVVHEVQVSAHPHQVGTEQVRRAACDGDRLTLVGPAPPGAPGQHRELRWRRVTAHPPIDPSVPPTSDHQRGAIQDESPDLAGLRADR